MRKKIFTFLLALAASVGMMNAAVDGKLSGAFTVNAGGDQVYFSQGNLQYQASTNTWRFAEHQYDFIGDAAGNTTVSGRDVQSDWIDLFGWATSGNSASGTAYQPWTNSADHSEYGPAITSGDWTYANSDWGINPISNGGNTAGSWRTLSQAEWHYLLFEREGNRFAYASLNIGGNYIYGLIILPDDWNTSYYALGSINETNHSYDSNEITAENWTNSLEAHGAVFLPITGSRNEDQIYGIDGEKSSGLYWSSTAGEYYEEIENEFELEQPIIIDIKNAAYALQFEGGYYIRNNVTRRATGVAVRLVYTEPSGDPTPTPKYFYMEVEGTAGTLKYGDKGSNPYYYESGAWNEGAFKSSITAITVDASCQNFDGTSLQSLFNSFFSLTSISGLENINTANVTNMQNTFSGNEQLTSLDLSSWNTANLENMSAIFFHCDKLVTLDLSSWNTANVTNMYYAFAMCPKLEHIYVGDEWSTASASSNAGMFTNCQKLPNYNEDVVDKTKAYAGEGGYLDYKAGSTPDPDPQDPEPTPSGDKLPGVFSISSTETVNFSKGNLQYVGGNWQFAENQWDVIGASQTNSSRDLFGWGTGNNPNQTSEEYEDYTTFADWGSNMGGDWRTLTRDEWFYIFNTRTSASDLRGSATVCGVHGYIILPDNFVLPGGLSWTPRPNNWTTNVYTSQEWSSMEENGAVFLPAAGYREGTTVHYDGSAWGYYWSATEHPQAYYAYCAWVADEDSYVRVYQRDRTYGHSVRLVSEATPTPSTPETSDNVDGIEEYIESLNGNTTDLIINRTMYKDGYFNTLCLPFSMNASEIAASCLAGCELFEFESATANGGGLDLYIAEADAIVAGKPYLIRWASGENLTSLSFTGVTITASTGQAVGEGVQFVGTIGRTQLENGNENHLFLGANNTLYWPNTNNKLKGFRAYFLVSGDVAPHGAPARVVVRPKTPTGIENANVNAKAVKLLREGQLFIIKNGVKYNAQGQIVK